MEALPGAEPEWLVWLALLADGAEAELLAALERLACPLLLEAPETLRPEELLALRLAELDREALPALPVLEWLEELKELEKLRLPLERLRLAEERLIEPLTPDWLGHGGLQVPSSATSSTCLRPSFSPAL